MSGRRVVHICTWVARALAVLLIITIPLFIEARRSDDTYRKVEGVQEPSLRHFRSSAPRLPTMPLDEAAADHRGSSNGQRALLSEAQAAPSWGQLPSKGPYTMHHLKTGTRGVFASPGHHTSASRYAWRTLAEKLDNGQGVTIHGIGSSILGNHGGCSEPLPVLKQLCESCCTLVGGDYKPHVDMTGLTAREGAGWARIALDWLNHTWPSSEHRLLNAARAGGGAVQYATCLTKNTPMLLEADLVLLEFGVTGAVYNTPDNLVHVENIIRQLMAMKRRPALMMVSFAEWCRGRGTIELCNDQPSEAPVSVASLLNHTVRSDTEHIRMAHHYDIPQVSTMDFMWPVMFPNISLAKARMGIVPPEDQMAKPPPELRKALGDGTHPSLEGTKVFGALVSYGLHVALQKSLHHLKETHHHHGHGGTTTSTTSSSAPSVPAPLLSKTARMAGSECYSFIQSEGRSNFSAIPDHELPQILAQWPPVTSSEGFDYVDVVPNREGQPRWKPGVVATVPGSYVELGLDLYGPWGSTDQQQEQEEKATFTLELIYLQSYEHMGQASVACSGGCTCDREVLDAHTTMRNSVTTGRTLGISTTNAGAPDAAAPSGAVCTVRIEVLPESSSGEHKFKLVHVTLHRHLTT